MKTYYNILDTIKNQLLQDNDCNSVTEGSIWEIDLDKQTLAPLSHIQVNNATRQGNTYVFNISVFCMDIVDKNPKATTNKFRGNDNEQDVLNTQLAVGARLVELMERGDLRDDNFALSGEPTFESFTERFENFWAGWTVTFDVQVPNEMTICDNVIPSGDCPDATYTITDLDGNTLYTGTIASGFSNTQAINNSTAVLKNTLGTTISTTEILAEGSEDITAPNALVGLEDTGGNVIGGDSFASGTVNTMVAPDGTVENSDLSYTDTVLSNGTLVLPDVTNTDSDGTPVVTPAQTPFVCTPAAPSGNGSKLLKTGQTISYATGDDGDLQEGRELDFLTLGDNNPFGDTYRFTDVLGTQVYSNNVVVDWSTNNGSVVLCYDKRFASSNQTALTWADALTACNALTLGGFSGWHMGNVREVENLCRLHHVAGTFPVFNYAPFNVSDYGFIFTSTTATNTSNAYYYQKVDGLRVVIAKTFAGGMNYVICRYYTLAELGL